jgi:hypothetical protein
MDVCGFQVYNLNSKSIIIHVDSNSISHLNDDVLDGPLNHSDLPQALLDLIHSIPIKQTDFSHAPLIPSGCRQVASFWLSKAGQLGPGN